MGLEGFRFGTLLVVLLVFVLLFGSKRIRHLGEELGSAVRHFRKALQEDKSENNEESSKSNDPTSH